MNPEFLIRLAGVAQIGLLTAGAAMTQVTDMRRHLAALPVFLRQLFYVYLGFVAGTLAALGVFTLACAGELAAGVPLARWFCAFAALFWAARLAVQLFVFDVRPYLTNAWLRVGYHATTGVFIGLVAIYAWLAWNGGAR